MIDVHCHLEQKNYNKDRDAVIEECRRKMKALVTCCAHPSDFDLTLKICSKYNGFVYCAVGLHPEFIKDLKEGEKEKLIEKIIENSCKISAIGEIGLDYHWIKEEEWREKQKGMFIEFLELAKKLDLPVVIHSRDAMQDTLSILEKQGMKGKKVLLHLFNEKNLLERVLKNSWSISIGPAILRSKDIRKIARDCPLGNLMLETDSPWFGFGKRGTPLNVIKAAEKIAEAKKISLQEVEKQTDLNAAKFFNLKIK